MKFSAIILATAFTGALASPAAETSERLPQLETRAACYHASDCSWFYGAKCENYCRQWGQNVGVARMEKCSLLNDKRCCCTA